MQQLHVSRPSLYLLQGDFNKLFYRLESNSIDLVLTDLPYPRVYLPLWSHVAREAKRVLKPGAFFISYSGHKYLPEVLSRLGEHLDYYWMANTVHDRGYLRDDVGFETWGKPVLFFQKPPRKLFISRFPDIIPAGGKEKEFHPWQQPVSEARALIQSFCPLGGWVLDPCAGSGTTLLAAHQTGRNAIGFEVNPQSYWKARKRLEKPAALVAT